MKYSIRAFVRTITLLVIICFLLISARASSLAHLEYDTVSDPEKTQILANINVKTVTGDISSATIECFDVNSDGLIAIGLNTRPNKIVQVFDPSGKFLYGYTFACSGSFGVKWDNDNLAIYFIRGDVVATFNQDAECTNLVRLRNSISNTQYIRNVILADEKKVLDKTYSLESNMGLFSTSYSRLIVRDDAGTETLIYNSNTIDITVPSILLSIVIISVIVMSRLRRSHIDK